ncbi:response regulator [Pseudomonas frederiksbergensis]|uniref:response regulator n=1 Tax=Pseudomonas frederiksbergensis TaxID=104087 RepID=UPI003D229F69
MNRHWKRLLPISGVVIVVEGDPTIRAFMMEVLSDIGLPLLGFENADDAFTHLSEMQGECPLVIADQGLPGQLQGTEFIEKVKSQWPSIAAIQTSGYDEGSHAVPPSAIYLRKPWSLDELVATVATLLQPGTPIHKRWIYTY